MENGQPKEQILPDALYGVRPPGEVLYKDTGADHLAALLAPRQMFGKSRSFQQCGLHAQVTSLGRQKDEFAHGFGSLSQGSVLRPMRRQDAGRCLAIQIGRAGRQLGLAGLCLFSL